MEQNISFATTCFMGKQRAGKTLSMVDYAYKILLFMRLEIKRLEEKKRLSKTEKDRLDLFKRYRLVSNLSLNKDIFGDYETFTGKKLLEMYENKEDLSHSIFVFDDIFKELDSRDFATRKNKIFSYFITEIGKQENILLYVSHFKNMVELRLRNFTEYFVWCRKGYKQDLRIRTKRDTFLFKDLWVEQDDYYELEKNPERLKKMIIEQLWFTEYIDYSDFMKSKTRIKKRLYINAAETFNKYKTREIV